MEIKKYIKATSPDVILVTLLLMVYELEIFIWLFQKNECANLFRMGFKGLRNVVKNFVKSVFTRFVVKAVPL